MRRMLERKRRGGGWLLLALLAAVVAASASESGACASGGACARADAVAGTEGAIARVLGNTQPCARVLRHRWWNGGLGAELHALSVAAAVALAGDRCLRVRRANEWVYGAAGAEATGVARLEHADADDEVAADVRWWAGELEPSGDVRDAANASEAALVEFAPDVTPNPWLLRHVVPRAADSRSLLLWRSQLVRALFQPSAAVRADAAEVCLFACRFQCRCSSVCLLIGSLFSISSTLFRCSFGINGKLHLLRPGCTIVLRFTSDAVTSRARLAAQLERSTGVSLPTQQLNNFQQSSTGWWRATTFLCWTNSTASVATMTK